MNNLQYLFSNIKKEPEPIQILDGLITLYRRPNSHQWQCRFKLGSGSWHQTSTSSDQVAEATTRAIAIYESVKVKISSNLAVVNKTFKKIAQDELEAVLSIKKLSNQTRNDYIYIINNYLIPFFGRYQIGSITEAMVNDFAAWRITQMRRVPKRDTQRYHATTYNRIIKRARANRFISENQVVPSLPIDGDPPKPRAGFSKQEIDRLLEYMKYWEHSEAHGRTVRAVKMQILCRCYVEFLLYTGIRQGTESMPVKWKDFQWHQIGEKRYLRVWVNGKTGPRYLIAKGQLIPALERLIQWQGLPYQGLNAVIEANLNRLVFVMPEGDQPHGFDGVFQRLMKGSGLWADHTGQKRTLYSLRHTYATFALADGVDIHTLARQMGTSVLMLEKHYSKLTPMMNAEKLAQ